MAFYHYIYKDLSEGLLLKHISSTDEVTSNMSRNGTVRNTDSFFNDDTVEMRRIILTPNIARDDSSTATSRSDESLKTPNFDMLEKNGSLGDKGKEEKKKKEKKSGMLSGLFKRKDRRERARSLEDDTSDQEKVSTEIRESDEFSASDRLASGDTAKSGNGSNKRSLSKNRLHKAKNDVTSRKNSRDGESEDGEGTQNHVDPDIQASPASITSKTKETEKGSKRSRSRSPENSVRSTPTDSHRRPAEAQKVVREAEVHPEQAAPPNRAAQQQDPLAEGGLIAKDPFADPESDQHRGRRPDRSNLDVKETSKTGSSSRSPSNTDTGVAASNVRDAAADSSRPLSSIVEAARHPSPPKSAPPPPPTTTPPPRPTITSAPLSRVMGASSIPRSASPQTLATPSTTLVNISQPSDTTHSTKTPAPSTSPTWSDASLRSYVDDGSDVRELLLLIRDQSNFVPITSDQPPAANLFRAERHALNEMSHRLDNILSDYLTRKARNTAQLTGRHTAVNTTALY